MPAALAGPLARIRSVLSTISLGLKVVIGLLAAGQDTGYSLLDQQGITTSEFQQQVTYQRAVEGELAKTLEAIKGVNTAVVHIALPKDQVFVADQGKPTASVLLAVAAGTSLSGEQISAVTT